MVVMLFFFCCYKNFSFHSHFNAWEIDLWVTYVTSFSTWVPWCLSTIYWMEIPSPALISFTIHCTHVSCTFGSLSGFFFPMCCFVFFFLCLWAIQGYSILQLCIWQVLIGKSSLWILLWQHFFRTVQSACQAFICKENLVTVLIGIALNQSPPPTVLKQMYIIWYWLLLLINALCPCIYLGFL